MLSSADATQPDLPWPFGSGPGLPRLLCDPELWVAVLPRRRLQAYKKVLKKISGMRQLAVDDTEAIGRAFYETLATPPGRQRLQKAHRRERVEGWERLELEIANRLHDHARLTHRNQVPRDDEVCERREDECMYIVSDRFADWLARRPLTEADAYPITLYACAFAVLQPEEGPRLFGILRSLPRSDQLLASHHVEIVPQGSLPPEVDEAPTEEEELPRPDPRTVAPAPHPAVVSTAPPATVRSNSDPLEPMRALLALDLPLLLAPENLGEWLDRVDAWVDEHRLVLAQLESDRARGQELASVLAASGWFHAPPPRDDLIGVEREGPTSERSAWWAGRLALLERAHRAHERATALSDVVGLEPAAFLRPDTSVERLVSHLEQRSEILDNRLRLEQERIRRVDDLLLACRSNPPPPEVWFGSIRGSDWLDLLGVLLTRTGEGARHPVRDAGLLGPVFAWLWTRDATSVVLWLEERSREPWVGEELASLLSLSSVADLRVLAELVPGVAPLVGAIACARSLAEADVDLVDSLEGWVPAAGAHAATREFCEALLQERRRGALTLPDSVAPSVGDDLGTAEGARSRLRELIENPPGMKGNYHRLRVVARERFLVPMREAVERDDPGAAWARWSQHGPLDACVAACVVEARPSMPHPVDDRHLLKTREYLEDVEELLTAWRDTADRRPAPPTRLQLAGSALRDLQTASGDAAVLRDALLGRTARSPLRLAAADPGRLAVGAWEPDPLDVWSFADAVEQRGVRLERWLYDRLRRCLRIGPVDVTSAVDELLAHARWTAAARMASGVPDLEHRVKERLEQHRTAFRSRHAELLAAATEARSNDEEIAAWLLELDAALESNAFAEAADYAVELERQLVRYRMHSDPVRKGLAEFLRAGGQPVGDDEQADTLRLRVAVLRDRSMDRRYHIVLLQEWLEDDLPTGLAESLRGAVVRLDHPASWPTESESVAVSEALEAVRKWFKARWQFREESDGDSVAQTLQAWLPTALAGTAGPASLKEVHDAIRAWVPDPRILAMMGARRTPPAPALEPAPAPPQATPPSAPSGTSVGTAPSATARDLVHELRSEILRLAGAEPDGQYFDVTSIQRMIREADWSRVRSATSVFLRSQPPTRELRFRAQEVAYALALAHLAPADDAEGRWLAWRRAALVTIHHEAKYLVREDVEVRDVTLRAVLAAAEVVGGAEDLPGALGELAQAPTHSPLLQRCSDLFGAAQFLVGRDEVAGSAVLSGRLWALLPARPPALGRANLLHLLYRARRLEAIRRLAAESQEFENLLVLLANAYHRAEADPEVRARAVQFLYSLREQSIHRPSLKPWVTFFSRLETVPSSTSPITCEPVSERVEEDDQGNIAIPLRMAPSMADPPETARIEVGGEGSGWAREVPEDELLKAGVVVLDVPRSALGGPGEIVEVPYRIVGRTVRGGPIDVRGAWNLRTVRVQAAEVLTPDELWSAWPGANGEPVIEGAFRGREAEIGRIAGYLTAPDRQRSVMVVGQRRIGKTSVLWRLMERFPPEPRRTVAAYVDVSGLRPGTGSLVGGLFERIVSSLEHHPLNEPLRRVLKDAGVRADIGTLSRRLVPERSLFAALTGLVQRLREASRGTISRIALLIDEFDRFVEPMQGSRAEEVSALMWEVRQVVQQSTDAALVLAGSGLLRVFTDDYREALFGSIEVVTLEPFDLEIDQLAILDTVMPGQVRRKICDDATLSEFVRAAWDACGGHPYFLSMLGYSVATALSGRRVTPHAVGRVVDRMVRGDIQSRRGPLDAPRFYGHTLETIRECMAPRTEGIAKLILVSMSQRTTTEYPWVTEQEAQDLVELSSVPEAERKRVLDALEREGVIARDGRRGAMPSVRVRVPLTRAALEHDALRLRQEAVLQLRGPDPA